MRSRFDGVYRLILVLFVIMLVAEIWLTVSSSGWRAVGRGLLYASPLFAVIGLAVLIVHLADRRSENIQDRYRRNGVPVRGRVIRVGKWTDGLLLRPRSGMQWEIAAEFVVDGRTYRASSNRLPSRPMYAVGDHINIYYIPGNPTDNMILDVDAM